MNIVEILQLMYPGQVEAGNITFYMPETEILIQSWNVPGVPQPTEAEVMAQEPVYQWQFDYNNLVSNSTRDAAFLFDSTAQSRGYNSELSCISYLTSTIETWSAEATAFFNWRDSMWSYLFAKYDEYNVHGAPLPTVEALMADAPQIVWPS